LFLCLLTAAEKRGREKTDYPVSKTVPQAQEECKMIRWKEKICITI
jgi:hypothetical protein